MTTRTIFLVLVLFSSCDKGDTQFHFRYKEDIIEEVNTFDNTFSRKYNSGQKTYKFHLTDEEQLTFDRLAKEFKIKDIDLLTDKDSCNGQLTVSFPTIDHEFEFSFGDGQTKIFKWGNNNCDDPLIDKVQRFADSLKVLILRKEELKDVKESDILIL